MPDLPGDLESLSSDDLTILGALALDVRFRRYEELVSLFDEAGVDTLAGRRFSVEAVKDAVARLQAQRWAEAEVHPAGRQWRLAGPVQEQVLEFLLRTRVALLPALARVLVEGAADRWWIGNLSLLFLAVVAQDARGASQAWASLVRSWAYEEPVGEDLTRIGLILRVAARNGLWASFPVAQKLRLVDLRARAAVSMGIPPRDLPALVRSVTAEPQVRQALDGWEAAASLVAGDLGRVRALSAFDNPPETVRGAAVLARWLAGDEPGALADLDALLAFRREQTGAKQEWFVPGPLFPLLACLALARDRAPVTKVKSWSVDHAPSFQGTAGILWALFRHRGKADAWDLAQNDISKIRLSGALDVLLVEVGALWLAPSTPGKGSRTAEGLEVLFERQGAPWYRLEAARVMARRASRPGVATSLVQSLQGQVGMTGGLVPLMDGEAPWEATLKRLADLNFDKAVTTRSTTDEVLCWLVDPDRALVEPVLRKPLRGGGWSAPKKAPVSRLAKGDHPSIQPEDRPALRAFRDGSFGWELDDKAALEALAGHPRLFFADRPDTGLTLEAVEAELRVEEGPLGLVFSFSVDLNPETAQLSKVAPDRWQVVVVGEKLKKVADVVGPRLVLPPEARSRVVGVLGSLAVGVPVRSPLLREGDRAETLVADPRPVLLLAPLGPGVSVEVHVRPLGPQTPLLRPGEGPTLVHGRVEGRVLTATREIRDELKAWSALLARCPNLDAWS
ncbi:MAG TPA: hypothetical protein VMB23_10345, partial [Spirochaetia bacterium]|nr:hypothetical protein [Spirochaetia bacterium]